MGWSLLSKRLCTPGMGFLVAAFFCSLSIKMGGVEMGFDLNIVWFEIWIMGEYFMAKHLHEAAQPRIGPKCLGAKVSGSQSEYVLVQGCSFNIKMGGVGLGFGLIIARFSTWLSW